jgi:WD40 repeat protein
VGSSGGIEAPESKGFSQEMLQEDTVTCVATERMGITNFIATGSSDTTVRLWSTTHLGTTQKLKHVHTFSGHTGNILCIDISVEFHVLVSGSTDCTAALWDIKTGKLLRILGMFRYYCDMTCM